MGFKGNKEYTVGKHKCSHSPDIDRGFSSIYVYTNIIRNQIVGHVHVPLLRVVPIQGKAFTTQYEEFQNLHYLTMNEVNIDIVEVLLTKDDGQLVSFDTGQVILTLHIRPKTIA